MAHVEEVYVYIRVPPEDYYPSAIEDLIPTDRPPARLGAPDQPHRPPPPPHLRLDPLIKSSRVPVADMLTIYARRLLGWNKALECVRRS